AQPLPMGFATKSEPARPPRRLLLVLRADLPPTSNPAARHALANGLNRGDLLDGLGPRGVRVTEWLPGGAPMEFPAHGAGEVQAWLERGKLGRSFHVVMAYASDGAGAEVARRIQAEWARLGLDTELRPFTSPEFAAAALDSGGAQALLVEAQGL